MLKLAPWGPDVYIITNEVSDFISGKIACIINAVQVKRVAAGHSFLGTDTGWKVGFILN